MRNNNISDRLYRKIVSNKSNYSPQQNQSTLIPKIVLKQQLEPIESRSPELISKTEVLRVNIPTQSQKLYSVLRGKSPMNNRLPALQTLNAEVKTISVKRPTNKRSGSEPKSKTINKEMNSSILANQLQTPLDFLNLLKRDPGMQEEFCYLNKGNNPYDWRVVQFAQRNQDEYMIISNRGITKYINDDIEYQDIEQWDRERRTFLKLQQIEFFNTYKKLKSFRMWKHLMRTNIMQNCAQVISSKLFYLDATLRKPLLEIRSLGCQLQQTPFFEHRFLNSLRTDQFKKISEEYRNKVLEKRFRQVDSQVKALLVEACIVSFDKFKHENRIIAKSEDKKTIEDSLPFTQEATIKTHFQRLKGFVKLTENLMIDSKVRMARNASEHLLTNVQRMNDMLTAETQVFGHVCWLKTDAAYLNQKITFVPGQNELISVIENIVQDGIRRIYQTHKNCLRYEELQTFLINVMDEMPTLQQERYEFQTMLQGDQQILQIQQKLRQELNQGYFILDRKSKFLLKFLEMTEKNQQLQQNLERLRDNRCDDFRNRLAQVKREEEEVSSIENTMDWGLFQLDCTQIKQVCKGFLQQTFKNLSDYLPELATDRAVKFNKEADMLTQRILQNPSSIRQFVQFQGTFLGIRVHFQELSLLCSDIQNMGVLMQDYRIKVPESCRERVSECLSKFNALKKRIEEIQNQYPNMVERFKRELVRMVPNFEERVQFLIDRVQKSDIGKSTTRVGNMYDFVLDTRRQLNQLLRDQKDLEEYQQALTMENAQFVSLNEFEKLFKIQEAIWTKYRGWLMKLNEWYKEHFLDLKLNEMRKFNQETKTFALQFKKDLDSNDISLHFLKTIDDFEHVLEGVECIPQSPDIDDSNKKHWQEIKQLLVEAKYKKDFDYQNFFDKPKQPIYTLKCLIDIGVGKLRNQLKEIAQRAQNENELQQQVLLVEQFWKSNNLVVHGYKDNKEYILGNNEELFQKVEDYIVTMENVLTSPFVEPIRLRAETQLKFLRFFQELMDEWNLHQKSWMYLEPILGSSYALKNLNKENKQFHQADQQWKKLMRQARENPQIRRWVEDVTNKVVFNTLKQNNQVFQQIRKALEEVMDKKREVFQRFYFIENEELLEVLSTCKIPQSIQPYLCKVFSTVMQIRFNKEIPQALIAQDGEECVLRHCILRGEVEDWFRAIEDSMRNSMKAHIRNALLKWEIEDIKRLEWMKDNSIQVIQAISSIIFTRVIEDILGNEESENNLNDLLDQLQNQIDDLLEFIRQEKNGMYLKNAQVLMLSDINRRDIVQFLRSEGNIQGLQDFKWQVQLRFYWEEEMLFTRYLRTRLNYGYEFQGSNAPCMQTPQTHRALAAIFQGIQLRGGIHIIGGTGKTEIVKDLTRNVGRYFFIININNDIGDLILKHQMIGSILTGTWICFKHFENIKYKQIQMISRIMLTVRDAILADKTDITIFGNRLLLNSQVCFFSVSRVPNRLTIFRQVSFQQIDFVVLLKSQLMCLGISDSQEKIKKILLVINTLNIYLNQPVHFNIIKDILIKFQQYKALTLNLNIQLDQIIIISLRDGIIKQLEVIKSNPSMFSDQISLLNQVLQDVFGEITDFNILLLTLPEYSLLSEYCEINNLSSLYIKQAYTLHLAIEAFKYNGGIPTVIGAPLSGKTTLIKMVHSIKQPTIPIQFFSCPGYYNTIGTSTQPGMLQNILMKEITPKEIQEKENYHDISSNSGLTSSIPSAYPTIYAQDFLKHNLEQTPQMGNTQISFQRKGSMTPQENKSTVVIRPSPQIIPIYSMLVLQDSTHTLGSIIDSNSLLFPNGMRIILHQLPVEIILEEEQLTHVTPSIVSKLNIINLPYDIDILDYLKKKLYIIRREFLTQEHYKELIISLEKNIKKITPFLEQNYQTIGYKWNIKGIINSTCSLIISMINTSTKTLNNNLFQSARPMNRSSANLRGEYAQTKAMERLTLWSLLNVLSFMMPLELQSKFEKFINEQFNLEQLRNQLTSSKFTWNKDEGELIPWGTVFSVEALENINLINNKLYVQTIQSIKLSWFIKQLQPQNCSIMIIGQSGVGKTAFLENYFLQNNIYTRINITLTQQQSPLYLQQAIEQRIQIQKRNKKLVLLPPINKQLMLCVEDVNMGSFNTQTFLDSIINLFGYFDRKIHLWKEFDNLTIYGQAQQILLIPQRLINKFLLIRINENQEDILNIFQYHFTINKNDFNREVRETLEQIIPATTQVYILSQQFLKPTPVNPQHQFTSHHIVKVLKNLTKQINQHNTRTTDDLTQIWLQETKRIFMDPIEERFSKIHAEMRRVIYQQISNFKSQLQDEQDYFSEQSQIIEQVNKELPFFSGTRYIIQDLGKIFMGIQRGHLVIVGVPGLGKNTLCKIAARICNFRIYTSLCTTKSQFQNELVHILKELILMDYDTLIIVSELQCQDYFQSLVKNVDIMAVLPLEEIEILTLQFNTTIDVINAKICKHLRFAFIINSQKLRILFTKNQTFLNVCSIVHIHQWLSDDYIKIARNIIKDTNLDVHPATSIYAIYQMLQDSKLSTINQSSYLRLVIEFQQRFNTQKEVLELKQKKLSSVIDLIMKSKQEQQDLEQQEQEENKNIEIIIKRVEEHIDSIKKLKANSEEMNEIIRDANFRVQEEFEKMNQLKNQYEITTISVQEEVDQYSLVLIAMEKSVHLELIRSQFFLQLVAALSIILEVDDKIIKQMFREQTIMERLQAIDVNSSQVQLEKLSIFLSQNPTFQPKEIKTPNVAKVLCQWIHAFHNSLSMRKEVKRKLKAFKTAEAEFASLRNKSSKISQDQQNLILQIRETEISLEVDKKLLSQYETNSNLTKSRRKLLIELFENIFELQKKWEAELQQTISDIQHLHGNTIIRSFIQILLGGVTEDEYSKSIQIIQSQLKKLNLAYTLDSQNISQEDKLRLQEQLTEISPIVVLDKQDSFLSLIKSKVPNLAQINIEDSDYLVQLVKEMRAGSVVVIRIQNPEQLLEGQLKTIITHQYKQKRLLILDEDSIIIHPTFKLYFVIFKIPLPNQLYQFIEIQKYKQPEKIFQNEILNLLLKDEKPEIFTKLTILQDQLYTNKLSLNRYEEELFDLLFQVQDSIENNLDRLNELSNKIANYIKKIEDTNKELKQINIGGYEEIALCLNTISQCTANFVSINPSYVYSFQLLKSIIQKIIRSFKDQNISDSNRIQNLKAFMINKLYQYIMISISNEHKLILSFLLVITLDLQQNLITNSQYRFIIEGNSILEGSFTNSPQDKLEIKSSQWQALNKLNQVSSAFDDIIKDFQKYTKDWVAWFQYTAQAPSFVQKLKPFDRLILYRSIRPEKVQKAALLYIENRMGIQPLKIENATLTSKIPILVFASDYNPLHLYMRDKSLVFYCEFGDQEVLTDKKIEESMARQMHMIFLNLSKSKKNFQNLVYSSIQSLLDQTYKGLIGDNFRFIIIEYNIDPTEIPFQILSNSLRIYYEPQRGIKQLVQQLYSEQANRKVHFIIFIKKLEECTKPKIWKKLIYSLTLMHAIFIGRNKYKDHGWSQPYSFSEQNYEILLNQIKFHIENSNEVNFEQLNQMILDTVYVTKSKVDRRYVEVSLQKFCHEMVLNDDYVFIEGLPYKSVPLMTQQEYANLFERLPDYDNPEIYGADGETAFQIEDNESNFFLKKLKNLNQDIKNKERIINYDSENLINELLILLPSVIEIKSVPLKQGKQLQMPVKTLEMKRVTLSRRTTTSVQLSNMKISDNYLDTVEQFILNEKYKYNVLIKTILEILSIAKKNIAPLNLEYQEYIATNRIPQKVLQYCYPTNAQTFTDLVTQINQNVQTLKNYSTCEKTKIVNINVFFSPKQFFHSLVLLLVKKYKIPLEQYYLNLEFTKLTEVQQIQALPSDGCVLIHGFRCFNCKWDQDKGKIVDTQPFDSESQTSFVFVSFIEQDYLKDNPIPVYRFSTIKFFFQLKFQESWDQIQEPLFYIDTPADFDNDFWVTRSAAFVLN